MIREVTRYLTTDDEEFEMRDVAERHQQELHRRDFWEEMNFTVSNGMKYDFHSRWANYDTVNNMLPALAQYLSNAYKPPTPTKYFSRPFKAWVDDNTDKLLDYIDGLSKFGEDT